ncbi:MAG TPA: hypothetical protein PLB01_10490 [Thermoanaerobaculia bacterium]|nr:hypothetical protein [Thermoanaerobaculia bacterium]
MTGTPPLRTLAASLVIAAVLAGPGSAATKKKGKATSTPAPTPAPTAVPTPTPTPTPELHKAAGSCLRYEAGAYIMLSEVGQPGRAFRIDSGTDITARPRRGARLRILYVDSPDGPIARKIMPGPVEEKKN